MKTIAIILTILAISILMFGCAKKVQQVPPQQVDPTVEPAIEQATEQETIKELDEVFVEDEEIDIGELY